MSHAMLSERAKPASILTTTAGTGSQVMLQMWQNGQGQQPFCVAGPCTYLNVLVGLCHISAISKYAFSWNFLSIQEQS